jgi:glycosyltransferase involved in cell wall biosynthesis
MIDALADKRPGRPVAVLITARELNLGGVERDVAKIAIGLDRTRFTPHVATYNAKGFRYQELQSAGVPLLHLPLTSLLSGEAARSARKLRRYIKEHKIQLVHSYDASGVFAAPIARASGVPVVITSQLSYRALLDPRTRKLLRISDRFADAVLVNCEAIRRYMIADEGVSAGRVELCYNGVVTDDFHPADANANVRPEQLANASLVIGTVCAFRPEKALGLFQEAFAKVLASQPENARPGIKLLFVGSGAELPGLQDNAARLGITAASIFVPATRDVAKWMRAIDIFALPSYSEAFSNALLEAMACGCAVVGSRIGGTPELIGSKEERGLLFPSGDVDEFADRLARLIADPALRHDLGAKAASFVRQNLTIEIAVERTSAIYEKLLTRKLKR